jgi:hypothetical protein
VQLTEHHWRFEGAHHPDAQGSLPKAITAVNNLAQPHDFIIFTGRLTHTANNPVARRRRLSEFKALYLR